MGCAEFNLCHPTTNLTLVQWSSKLYNENSQGASMIFSMIIFQILSICHAPQILEIHLVCHSLYATMSYLGVWQLLSLACTEESEPQNSPHTHRTSQPLAFSRPFVISVFWLHVSPYRQCLHVSQRRLWELGQLLPVHPTFLTTSYCSVPLWFKGIQSCGDVIMCSGTSESIVLGPVL